MRLSEIPHKLNPPDVKLIADNLIGAYKMAKYVDGFVLVVPKGKEAEYQGRKRLFKR